MDGTPIRLGSVDEMLAEGTPVESGEVVDFPASNDPDALRLDLEAALITAADAAEALAKLASSRSLSMIRTKLDEAQMWFVHGPELDVVGGGE